MNFSSKLKFCAPKIRPNAKPETVGSNAYRTRQTKQNSVNQNTEINDYANFFDFIIEESKLSAFEIECLFRDLYINFNTLKGDKNLFCLFPQCETKGVEKSHLFAESLIRQFSIKGKVLTKCFYPKDLLKNINYTVEEVGVGTALTFPGFCKICEQKFEFEKKKQLVTPKDYLLQLLRSASYELRIAQIEKIHVEKIIKLIINKSSKKSELYFQKKVSNIKLTGVNEVETFLSEQIVELNKRIEVQSKLYRKVCRIYSEEASGKILNIKMKIFLPIFLMYSGKLEIENLKGNVILNLCPVNSEYSEITILDFNNKFSTQYLERLIHDNIITIIINLLTISNNWIINKEFWDNQISFEVKQEILKNRFFDRH
jgi:hypothetical protein